MGGGQLGRSQPGGEQLALFVRTAVRLSPGQVAHRARLRAQRAALRRWPEAGRKLMAGPDPARATGWPASFAPVESRVPLARPGLADLAAGRIELLGMARDLGCPPDWRQDKAPLLWRFHLHYWDWAWGLAGEPDRVAARSEYAGLWRSWQAAAADDRGVAWSPYPAALRAWACCGQYASLVAGGEIEEPFLRELAHHAGFLRRHLESDVGGNHLIKDLKALTGLAVFFGDEGLLRRSLRRLEGQLAIQVLADGGHYERAPAYHCQVLGDLIDVRDLLEAAGIAAAAGPALGEAITRMRDWLGCVLLPGGRVPLLNDGYPVPRQLVVALGPSPAPASPVLLLSGTGLARAAVAGWHLLADVGPPCPDGLPAHAHADTLGCLVQVDGVPLLVDTGTSTYEAGAERDYERSTAAHSTVMIDATDSTEVWAAFRAGRRARVRDVLARATPDLVTVQAAHDGYRHLPGGPVHRRRWSVTAAELRIDDEIAGRGRHRVEARWHLAPGSLVRAEEAPAGSTAAATQARLRVAVFAGPTLEVTMSAPVPLRVTIGAAPVAAGFGVMASGPVITCQLDTELPVQVSTRWRRTGGSHG